MYTRLIVEPAGARYTGEFDPLLQYEHDTVRFGVSLATCVEPAVALL
jgi:hypothetical protein